MWYVYILKCCDGKYYTGCTSDINNRIKRHNQGQIQFTKVRLRLKSLVILFLWISIRLINTSDILNQDQEWHFEIKGLSDHYKLALVCNECRDVARFKRAVFMHVSETRAIGRSRIAHDEDLLAKCNRKQIHFNAFCNTSRSLS